MPTPEIDARNLAYRSHEAFERSLPEAFAARLGPALDAAERAMVQEDVQAQMRIAAEANAFHVGVSDLEQVPALVLGQEEKESADAQRGRARELLVTGGYAAQFLFSGAATRLGIGALYSLDLHELADVIRGASPEIDPDLRGRVLGRLSELPPALRSEIDQAAVPDGGARYALGLGPRQLLQYRVRLESLAREAGRDPERAVQAALLVIHCSEASEEEILRDLKRHDFYGFNRSRVCFLTQPEGHGYAIQGGEIVVDPLSPRLPAGHGYPLAQFFQRGAAFRVGMGGRRSAVKETLISAIFSLGARVMGSHRVNDLTRLTAEVVDVERLSLALALMADLSDPGIGRNWIVELVDNPKGQKGGFWKRDRRSGRKALAETLNLKTPELEGCTAGLRNAPYNAFRNLYKLSALESFLPKYGFFTPFLRFRDHRLYPETVTGEATEYEEMRAEAIRKPGELIHDFKEFGDLPEGLRFVRAQDADAAFAALAAEL